MPSLTISTTGKLDDALRRMPKGIQDHFSQGLVLISSLPTSKMIDVINDILADIEAGGGAVEPKDISEKFDFSEEDSSSIGFSLAILTTIVTEQKETIDEISSSLLEYNILPKENIEFLNTVISEIEKNKNSLKNSLDNQELGVRVLPSLTGIDIVVEMRFDFEKTDIKRSIPIAIAYIATDSARHQLWVQLTKADIAKLIRQLTEISEQMDVVSNLRLKN